MLTSQGINIVAEDVGEFQIELHDLETQAKVVELIQVADIMEQLKGE